MRSLFDACTRYQPHDVTTHKKRDREKFDEPAWYATESYKRAWAQANPEAARVPIFFDC